MLASSLVVVLEEEDAPLLATRQDDA